MKKNYELGSLILRVVLGVSFLIHGFIKFNDGIAGTAGWFDSIGIPGFMAYVVALIEVVGGIAMILGIGTRIVAALFAVVMLGAIFTVKLSVGFAGNGQMAGYELDLAFLVMSVYLLLNGSDKLSLQAVLKPNQQS
ncbi:DoxX family protein [Peribacillus asahii]|uniref:Oxidoreductase n=1 Tax=Peribacillus asahii TaxID=228899 RepID=A0A3T0KKZ6_9BACI|nr:DoxX family protein [Peribacillus asahii]AZV40993.1 oxidoreductase [Peribacillus asahii]USK85415.1 DoxX family protein [Peribacillus asahii]